MYEKEITIPTYMMDAPDKIPHFYTGRAYQGAQGRVYPYPYNGTLTDEKKSISYKGLFMENEYLKICVLPELGGRMYYMIDKTNGYNVIYRNNVVKPSLIGMLGAWISGGVEWNLPHHHRASTFMPTDFKLVDNEDGSKTIWVGELEFRHQVRWMVGMTMFPDNAMVKIDLRYINQTPMAHPFLVWANTAIHTNDSYQIIYPPLTEYATYHRKVDFTKWPISNELYRGSQFENTDISYWKNTPNGGSFFAWEDQGQFVAGIDHGEKAGLCVVGNKNIVVGKKLWTWGTTASADMWEQILTDKDGPYLEIMTGAYSNNQPDYSWCHPYFTKEATMHYMPLRGLTGVKESTLEAAINFDIESETKVLVEVHGYKEISNAIINVKKGEKTIWTTTVDLDPSNSFRWSVDIEGADYYDLSMEVRSKKGKELVSYQPKHKPGNPMPETVKPAQAPSDIETVEELAFTGLRLEQIFNPLVSPLPYYEEAVKRAPNNAFANLRIGSWYLKEGIFEKAEKHLQRTTDRWTTDYTRAKDGESLYLLGITRIALGKEQQAYDNFYSASWDYEWYGASHLQLSMIESKRGNYKEALDHIEKAISVDIHNIRAQEIKLSLLRQLDRTEDAIRQLAKIGRKDALNLYTHGEILVMGETDGQAFSKKMRGEIQNYLDMAVKLGKLGMYKEASTILQVAENDSNPIVHSNALVYYYLGYFNQLAGNQKIGNQYYQKAFEQKTDYCFPFRYETENVLASAITANPVDYKALYYWGNLLFDHQPEKAITKWEKSVKLNGEFAMAHRNLAFASDHVKNNPKRAKEEIELALRFDPMDPDFYYENDNYAIKTRVTPEERLQQLYSAGNVLDGKDDPLARRVNLELICDSVDRAIQTLQNHHFRKVEGVGNIHNSWVDAWMLKGKEHLAKGETEAGLKSFKKMLEYPRNLDIGQNNREGISYYFIGLAWEKMGKRRSAKENFGRAVEYEFSIKDLYFKGLAFNKLKDNEKAEKIFTDLIKRGEENIINIGETDFFSMFGNQSSDNVRLAEAHTLIGLGNWGLNKKEKAEPAFRNSLEEDPSNFMAKTRLFE